MDPGDDGIPQLRVHSAAGLLDLPGTALLMLIDCYAHCLQGLLGGFAVVTVYVRTSAPSDEDSAFLHAYEPIANEVRSVPPIPQSSAMS